MSFHFAWSFPPHHPNPVPTVLTSPLETSKENEAYFRLSGFHTNFLNWTISSLGERQTGVRRTAHAKGNRRAYQQFYGCSFSWQHIRAMFPCPKGRWWKNANNGSGFVCFYFTFALMVFPPCISFINIYAFILGLQFVTCSVPGCKL